ncbi:hypothetical protein [Ferroplasma sp.]|uniref:hypothetical protein n=1 Tax=Ferroplasma sp. TaxID=2591003 RepID=UPI00307D0046
MLTDDTLREGMQSPGFALSYNEKMELARLISIAGVKRSLVAYPSAHKSEFQVAKDIADKRYFNEIFALGRTIKADIDLINDTGANISLHLPFKIDNMNDIYENIKYACTLGKIVEVGFVDIDMFDINEILKFCNKMAELNVDVVQLPDTRGKMEPEAMKKIIEAASKIKGIKIEAHCHNDHGLAMANSISAISSGADYIDTTIFGMGERNGIADSITVVDYLNRHGIEGDINIDSMRMAYNYMYDIIIRKIGDKFFTDNMPVYGNNSEIQTAGTHVAYGSVFSANHYSVNVYTGRKMIIEILKNNNIQYNENNIGNIVKRIKDESASRGEALPVSDIIKIAGDTL